jgi:hypothetical protein
MAKTAQGISRSDDIEAQHRTLTRKLTGHYAYYGVTSNYDALARLWREAVLTWRIPGLPDSCFQRSGDHGAKLLMRSIQEEHD